MEAARSFGERG